MGSELFSDPAVVDSILLNLGIRTRETKILVMERARLVVPATIFMNKKNGLNCRNVWV